MRRDMIAAMLILAGGCTPSATQPCQPDNTFADPQFGLEARARTADPIEVWALFFNTFPMRPAGEPIEIPVNTELKIVWRVTGEGKFTTEAVGPEGVIIEPDWGPDIHGGSNWQRPGDEWGTGWTFPEVGCWTLVVHRGDSEAVMSVNIHAGTR